MLLNVIFSFFFHQPTYQAFVLHFVVLCYHGNNNKGYIILIIIRFVTAARARAQVACVVWMTAVSVYFAGHLIQNFRISNSVTKSAQCTPGRKSTKFMFENICPLITNQVFKHSKHGKTLYHIGLMQFSILLQRYNMIPVCRIKMKSAQIATATSERWCKSTACHTLSRGGRKPRLPGAMVADHVTDVSTHWHAHARTHTLMKMAALERRIVSPSVNGDVDVSLDVPGDMTDVDVVDEEDIQKEVSGSCMLTIGGRWWRVASASAGCVLLATAVQLDVLKGGGVSILCTSLVWEYSMKHGVVLGSGRWGSCPWFSRQMTVLLRRVAQIISGWIIPSHDAEFVERRLTAADQWDLTGPKWQWSRP